ncbi:hypothetical protein BH18ACT8_BH18ACT8_16360 [soil metagenome]
MEAAAAGKLSGERVKEVTLYSRLARTIAAVGLALMALVTLIAFANRRDAADLIVPITLAALAWWLWRRRRRQ